MTNSNRITKNLQQEPKLWLRDIDKSNGVRYDALKALTQNEVAPLLQKSPYSSGRKRACRMAECSESIYGQVYADSKGEAKFKVLSANACRVRVCPSCSFRLARKHFILGSNRLEKIYEEERVKRPDKRSRFVFLTLTIKNVDVHNLKEAIRSMSKAWNRLMNRKTVKPYIDGFIRSLEVTRGEDGTAHPHYHVLLLLKPSYFNGRIGRYHTTDWVKMWRESLGVDYDPICDIRALKANKRKGLSPLQASLLELMKYITKYDHALLNDPAFFLEFEHQIEGIRFFNTGGRLKGVISENLSEEELDELIQDEDCAEELGRYFFTWYKSYQRYGC